ncbi:MAG: DUF6186 family protein [Nocardioidaceae bacterium]
MVRVRRRGVHVVRQNLVDVVVFVGTAVLILVDASRPWRDRTTPLVRLTPAVAGWVCLAYAAVLLPLSRTGGGWSGPRSWSRCACSRSSTSSTSPTPRPTAARPTLSALIDPLLARAGRAGVPTFGALVRLAMRSRSAQLGLVLTRWWLGWHFLLAL